jgi:hypothetical protein
MKMKVVKLNCTACGAPISIPESVDQLNCSACGSFLQVDRGEGYITLRVLEKLTKAIETTGKETTDAIKESSFVTKTELQKLQIQQEIIANQTILANIETEIRTLKRSGIDNINANEIDNLYEKQYKILDKLRNLEQKYLSPLPNDIEGLISAIKNDISYIDQMLTVLYLSNLSNKSDAINSLKKMRSVRVDSITNLKANEIRKNFPIFQQKFNEVQETEQALIYLNSLSEAETSILSLPDSPEKDLLIREIKQLKDKLSKDWAELEKGRVSMMLHLIPSIPENDDLDNMIAKMGFMDENIRVLLNQNQNWVVKDLLKEQERKRFKLQTRISKAERQLQREQARLAKAHAYDQGKLEKDNRNKLGQEAFLASIGVFLGGLWLAGKSIFPQKNAKNELGSVNSEIIESKNQKRRIYTPDLKYKSIEEGASKSIKKGIIYSVIVLISFFCVGIFLIMMVEVIFSIESSKNTAGFILLILLISFLIAQKIFMSQAFGLVYIKGKLVVPNIYLSKNHPTHGIKNSTIVKILVGIFVFISFGMLLTTIATFIPLIEEGNPSAFAVFLFFLAIIMSPIIGLISGLRTKVTLIDQPV